MATPEELAAFEAAEAEKRRLAEEAAKLAPYRTLGYQGVGLAPASTYLGGGMAGAAGPNEFQDWWLAQNAPDYTFLDDTPDESGGAIWRGPGYEQFPDLRGDTDRVPYDYAPDVMKALQGVNQDEVEQYWTQQREQAAINAYYAPWLGPQYVDTAVQLADARRRQMENPQDRQASADVARLNAMLPASPKGNAFDVVVGGLRNLATNPVIMAALTAGLATPATVGGTAMLTPMQAAATTGAISGAASDDPLMGALRGAGIGAATVGVGDYAGEAARGMFEAPWIEGLARGGAAGLTSAALSGAENPWLAGLQGAAMGALSAPGPTPTLSDQEFEALLADTDLDAMLAQPTTQPIQLASTGMLPGLYTGAFTPAMQTTPEMALAGELAPMAPAPLTPVAPEIMDPMTSLLGLTPAISGEDTEPAATEEALTGEEPTAEAPKTEKEMKLADYVKMAKKVYDLMVQMGFGQDTPEFALPDRGENESEEEYLARVSDLALDYLGLDADAMRTAGYEPGTQEYLDYILAQADKVIAAAFGDAPIEELAGQSVEDLQAAFRGKSEAEMEELARALYTRGALGALSFREAQIDPFTGALEETGLLSGEAAGPTAGAQRGYARFLEETSKLTAPEARKAIRGMLGRNVDLFGLEKARKAGELQAMLEDFTASTPEDEEEDQYERRGGSRGIARRAPTARSRGFWDQFRR